MISCSGLDNSGDSTPTVILSGVADQATDVSDMPTLSWSSAGLTAPTYTLYLDGNNPPTTMITLTAMTDTSYTPSTALTAISTYYWKVLNLEEAIGVEG